MPVERYRDIADMPRPLRVVGAELLVRMAAAWELAHVRGLPEMPRGVSRFRTLQEAQAAREAQIRAHMRSLRAPCALGG